jgi:hypothetical protein
MASVSIQHPAQQNLAQVTETAPQNLWSAWWQAIYQLHPAFTRFRTFLWFAAIVAGFIVRTDSFGASSFIRALGLDGKHYSSLLKTFHSRAIRLDCLVRLWTKLVLQIFPNPYRLNGRLVIIGDGTKAPKRGKQMPGVKLLHQESEGNTKPEWIMGHSLQGVSLLVHAAKSMISVPLAMRIHEGIVTSNRDQRTLHDKMITLLNGLELADPYYFVGDAYYANAKIISGLRAQGNHLISRMRRNATGYLLAPPQERKTRGRPQKYGEKIKLMSLFEDRSAMCEVNVQLYGEDVKIKYRVCDLLWKPAGCLIRIVAVEHPTKGRCLLMSTDTALEAIDILRTYTFRFKIEFGFKQATQLFQSMSYHFWMRGMEPIRRGTGDQYLHRKTAEYREQVKRKLHAYHVYIQAGLVAQGLLQYLSVVFPEAVWRSFGSWLRTIRPGIAPSEFVTAQALAQRLPDFLALSNDDQIFVKFLHERQALQNQEPLLFAA